MSNYIEERPEMGMKIEWENVTILDKMITSRGTLVEMIHRPCWGIACYMDNQIQSCECDENIYHMALVQPAMASAISKKRVMIIGGGEGATLREVVKWDTVEKIDMYEWDKDVVTLFQTKYPQWAKGAWDDPRVTMYHDDIFSVISQPPSQKYDIIIVDLFDPNDDNVEEWKTLCDSLEQWITKDGIITMYAGMRFLPSSERLIRIIRESLLLDRTITPYHRHILSFSGESTFIMLSRDESLVTSSDANSSTIFNSL